MQKGTKQLEMEPKLTIVAPPEAILRWTLHIVMGTGKAVQTNGISYFKFGEDGKVLQMRAFWDTKELISQLKS